MKPILINADYMVSPNDIPDVEKLTEIHFTRFGSNPIPGGNPSFLYNDSYKIFCHVNEPTTSRWVEPIDNIVKNHLHYNKIVTSNPEILEKCKNAVFMIYGTTWLNKSNHHPDSFGKYTDDLGTLNKELSLSMVCGSLTGKPGYNLRHIIFQNQNKINVVKKFYSSTRFIIPGYPILPNDDKINLFNSMYSVVVESSQEKNYFSEKIIDCLITKTIPVYWGCPNINEFFDTSYWIRPEDIFSFKFTKEYYNKHAIAIQINFEKTKKYCDNFIKRVLNA